MSSFMPHHCLSCPMVPYRVLQRPMAPYHIRWGYITAYVLSRPMTCHDFCPILSDVVICSITSYVILCDFMSSHVIPCHPMSSLFHPMLLALYHILCHFMATDVVLCRPMASIHRQSRPCVLLKEGPHILKSSSPQSRKPVSPYATGSRSQLQSTPFVHRDPVCSCHEKSSCRYDGSAGQ